MSHTVWNDSKQVFHLSIPLISSRLINTTVSLAGTLLVARLGHHVLAASALSFAIYATLMMICFGILYAVGILAGNAYGAKQYGAVGSVIRQGFLVTLILGVPIQLIMWFVTPLLHYLGQSPTLIPLVEQFLRGFSLSVLPSLWYVIMNQYLTAVSRPRIILYLSILNLVMSVSLFYLLIFGKGGFPALGIWAVGVTYAISSLTITIILLGYTLLNSHFHRFDLLRLPRQLSFQYVKSIFRVGGPIGIQYGAELGVFSVVTILIGLFGVEALAAQQISMQVIVMAIMIPFGMSQATAILVGQSCGEQNLPLARRYGFLSCYLGGGILILIGLVLLIFPHLFIGFYVNLNNPKAHKIIHIAVLFITVAAFSQGFDGIRNIISGALRGLQDSKAPMYVGILVTWVIGLPLGILFAFVFKVGPVGLNIGFAIAVLFGAIILLRRFHKKTLPLKD